MSGNSSTTLPTGSGGDVFYAEDVGGGVLMAASKIHVGSVGSDGGPALASNPLAVQESDGTNPTFPAGSAAGDGESAATVVTRALFRLLGFNGATWDRLVAGLTTPGALTGMLAALWAQIYHSTRSARTNGQGGPLEANRNGDVSVAPGVLVATSFTGAPSAGSVILTGASRVYAIWISQASGGTVWPMLFDAATTQPNASVPYANAGAVANNASVVLPVGTPISGLPFTSGIVIQISGTANNWSDTGSTLFSGYVFHYP